MIEISFTAFFICLVSLIIIRPLAIKFNLVDYPTERKGHIGDIPLVGGICVFLGLSITYILFIEFDTFCSLLIITALLILIHGVWDDYANLNAETKIAFQVISSAIMIYFTNVKLQSFGDLFGISYTVQLGIFSIPITIIAVIALTNAINMMDGLDGLAAGIVMIAIMGLICVNLTQEFSPFSAILLTLIAAMLPFVIFNIAPYPQVKVFLGDGGSLFLGYIISWSLIYSAENINDFNPRFALWCVAIPLFDFCTVIILRIVNKKSLMIAKRDHIHHYLENFGFSKQLILLLIVSFGLAVLLIGSLIERNFSDLSFPLFLIFFSFYLFIRIYKKPEKNDKKY